MYYVTPSLWDQAVLPVCMCIRNDNPIPDNSFIRLGTHSLNEPSVFYRTISRIVSHPQYQPFDLLRHCFGEDERKGVLFLPGEAHVPAQTEW